MKSLLLPAFLFAVLHLSAQYETILEDSTVSWAAEIELTLPADPLEFSAKEDRTASLAALKLSAEYEPSLQGYVNHSLNAKLWDIAENGDWEAFSDAELTRPLDAEELAQIISGPDTIITFDQATYEEKVQIAWDMRPMPHEARFVKVRQLLTYNDEDATFQVYTLAMAPFTGREAPRFWLKVPATEDFFEPDSLIANPDVTWAVRYVTNEASPRVSDFQVLKDETGPVIERFFDRIMADTSVLLYGSLLDDKPLSSDKRACLFSCTDSVSTFDPETYVEHVEVFHTELLPDQIIDLQLIEEFFWQEEDGLLYTRLVAVSPRYKFYYQEGQWYPRIGFCRRCDED